MSLAIYRKEEHAPVKDPKYLAWIKTFPCIVCGRSRNVDPCHTPGSRGMSQKTDDRRAVPMCRVHHEEQGRIGWKRFLEIYNGLDLNWWIELFSVKSRVARVQLKEGPVWFASRPVPPGIPELTSSASIHIGPRFKAAILRDRVREWIIDNVYFWKFRAEM